MSSLAWLACAGLERLLGSYSEGVCREWLPSIILMSGLMAVLFLMNYRVLGLVGVVFTLLGLVLGGLIVGVVTWSYCFLASLVLSVDSIRGPLQSVQRAELWGVILALQCSSAVHLGVDNLNVVRHVSRILEGRVPCRPFEHTFDGDLLTIIERMIHLMGCSEYQGFQG